jgi:general secretion pathway protein K
MYSGQLAHQKEKGSAILTAMLTVAMVATLASTALWQQWRNTEIERAERSRLQAHWILLGALDWARLILQEDGRDNNVDHLSEPWSVPLQEARLSTFLAGAQTTDADGDVPDVFLSGQISDAQSHLNLANLVQGGVVDTAAQTAFQRLFQQLGVNTTVLTTISQQLAKAQKAATSGESSAASPLPTRFSQLVWLGVSPALLEQISPFVTWLPVPTPVNLNTAPAEVVYAVVKELSWSKAQNFVQNRTQQHLSTLGDLAARTGLGKLVFDPSLQAVNTRYFEVRATLRDDLGSTSEASLVQRDGVQTQVLWRSAVGPTALIASTDSAQ